MKNSAIQSEIESLRQKAEQVAKKRLEMKNILPSVPEMLKLIEELEIYQVELEMQNEELIRTRSDAQLAAGKYTELYDFAPLGYLTLSKEGKIMDLNLTGAKILGKERSRLKNSLFGSFVSDDTKQSFNLFLKKVFKNKTKETCDVTLIVHGNIPMDVQLTGIVTKKGEQCLATMIDLTGKKEVEEALAISEIRYRRLFETAKDGIIILDAETGKIMDVNPFLIGMLGYTEEQLIERRIWEIEFFKDIAANHDKFIKLQKEGFVRYEDLPLETRDGRQINVEFVSNGYLVDKKKVIQCNIRDITERKLIQDSIKASQAKLKELNIAKDKFFSIISHDLKSPFHGILGFSDTLKKDAKEMDISTIQEFADMINRAALQVFNLLEGLLSWARIQQGQMAFNPTGMALKGVINETIELLNDEAVGKKITIINHIGEELMVKADGDMFNTIVRNLVSNAIKFTSAYGVVDIDAVEDSGQIEISVKDNGKGMKSENLDKLFKIDIIYSTRGTKEEAGTGLGLILCKEFVEKNGGKIWAESELDKGSVFHFTLPSTGNEAKMEFSAPDKNMRKRA